MGQQALKPLFSDIADAIREKDGGTEKIVAEDFPERIRGIRTSPKYLLGRDWFKVELPGEGICEEIAYGGGIFVIVCQNSSDMYYSKDGVHWELSTLPAAPYWKSVAYGGGKFVAVASNNSNLAAYSIDGINWVSAELPSKANWYDITYGSGIFVTCASPNKVAYSTDGIHWTAVTLPISAGWEGIAYGNGKFVVVPYNGDDVVYSSDGTLWNYTKMPFSAYWGHETTYGNGKFVSIPTNSKRGAYSVDGIDWNSVDLPSQEYWKGLSYGSGRFFLNATRKNSQNFSAFMNSIDGIKWNLTPASKSTVIESVFASVFGQGILVALCSRAIYYSFTGDDPATAT